MFNLIPVHIYMHIRTFPNDYSYFYSQNLFTHTKARLCDFMEKGILLNHISILNNIFSHFSFTKNHMNINYLIPFISYMIDNLFFDIILLEHHITHV